MTEDSSFPIENFYWTVASGSTKSAMKRLTEDDTSDIEIDVPDSKKPQRHNAGQVKASTGSVPDEYDQIDPEIEKDLLQKYVAYAKANIIPQLTDEAENRLNSFYVDLRGEGSNNDVIH